MTEWDKKREVVQYYDTTARMYDMRYAEEQTAKVEAGLSIIKIEGHNLVLDLGCGTGVLFDHVAGKAEIIVGLDMSRGILYLAKKRAENIQGVHLVLADADNMPLKENVIDHVFAVTLIQNTPNPVKTLNEIKRVAKENATFVVTGLKKAFALEEFRELLRGAGLKVVALKDDDLQCHVAVCTKICR